MNDFILGWDIVYYLISGLIPLAILVGIMIIPICDKDHKLNLNEPKQIIISILFIFIRGIVGFTILNSSKKYDRCQDIKGLMKEVNIEVNQRLGHEKADEIFQQKKYIERRNCNEY